MADAPADPALFYTRHIFMCTNVRPEGHPRGCCMARGEAAGGFEKLRGYMREKARAARRREHPASTPRAVSTAANSARTW